MLLELYIKNIAIIHELRIYFESGFSAITGETGAGKSILLGALNIVLGERIKGDLLPEGASKGSVEAVFDISCHPSLYLYLDSQGIAIEKEEPLILRREIQRQGAHRNFTNGQSVPLSVLKYLGDQLVDFHGQHEHQSLFHSSEQLDLLDQYAKAIPLRKQVETLCHEFSDLKGQADELRRMDLEKKERIEFLEYQVQEIEQAQLVEGEEEQLEEEQNRLAHAEQLKTFFYEGIQALTESENAAAEGIGRVLRHMVEAGKIDVKYESFAQRLEALQIELKEIAGGMQDELESFDADPMRLEQIDHRLSLIWRLKKKYGQSLSEVLHFLSLQKDQLEQLSSIGEKLGELEKKIEQLNQELQQAAKKLTQERKKAALLLQKKVAGELSELGMPECSFQIAFEKTSIGVAGLEKAEFLIAPNIGEKPKPLRMIASGGEISRIMLALKGVFAQESTVPTLIFDEIDVNLSAKITQQVGKKMVQLGKKKQILCITHMPQVASQAAHHYRVEKKVAEGRTHTLISLLNQNQRVEEIARMLQGEKITSITLKHAHELIKGNQV